MIGKVSTSLTLALSNAQEMREIDKVYHRIKRRVIMLGRKLQKIEQVKRVRVVPVTRIKRQLAHSDVERQSYATRKLWPFYGGK